MSQLVIRTNRSCKWPLTHLSHITDGETSQRRVITEGLDTHRLRWDHLNDGCITRLDKFRGVFDRLASTTIDLLQKLRKLAGDVSSVAVKHRCVTSANLTRVVKDDDLGVERIGTLGGVVLRVTSNVATTNLLDGDVLYVEAHVISWKTLDELFVVHLHGLDFSGHVGRGEGDNLDRK